MLYSEFRSLTWHFLVAFLAFTCLAVASGCSSTEEASAEEARAEGENETSGQDVVTCKASPSRLLAEEGCMWVRLEAASVSPNPQDVQAPLLPSNTGNQTSWPPDGKARMNISLSRDQVARNQSIPILQVVYDLAMQRTFNDPQFVFRLSMRTVPSKSFQLRAIGPKKNEHTSPSFSGEATVDLPFDLFDLGRRGEIRLFVQPAQTDSGPPQTAIRGRVHFHEAYIQSTFPTSDDS